MSSQALLKPVSQVRILPGALVFLQVSVGFGFSPPTGLGLFWSVLGRQFFGTRCVRSRFMLDISVPVGALRCWDAVPVGLRHQFR